MHNGSIITDRNVDLRRGVGPPGRRGFVGPSGEAVEITRSQIGSARCRGLDEIRNRVAHHAKINRASAAAIVIFWPAVFFIGGDKQTAA